MAMQAVGVYATTSAWRYVQCGILTPVITSVVDDQSRIRSLETCGVQQPQHSGGAVEQGFRAALTAREGNQSRTHQGAVWAS